uniref:Transcription initiation factor IIB n=1 Tax=Fundulus heteroclitus TaxID=8078 RepID=A0A146UL77_FUNHE
MIRIFRYLFFATTVGHLSNSSSTDAKNKYRNMRMMNSTDRSVAAGFKEARAMIERLTLPQSVLSRTEVLFKKVQDSKGLRGRSQFAVVAACVYIACRRENAMRSLKEVCAASQANRRDVGRCFKQILSVLEERVEMIKIEDFMSRFCSQLAVSAEVRELAEHICNKVTEMDLVGGRAPLSVAATSIFMAGLAYRANIDIKKIVMVSGVTENTMKVIYRQLRGEASKLYPAEKKPPVPFERLPIL